MNERKCRERRKSFGSPCVSHGKLPARLKDGPVVPNTEPWVVKFESKPPSEELKGKTSCLINLTNYITYALHN